MHPAEDTALDEARRRLAAIAGISARAAATAPFKPLPGLTNRVYRVDLPEGRFVLRIPGAGTAAIIDRRAEEANARAAAAAGIAPELIHFGADGVMLTRFVAGEPLTPATMTRPGVLERVGAALGRLHDEVPAFVSRLGPFATIDAYRRVLAESGVALTARQAAVLEEAESVRTALAAAPVAFRACHCDPTGRNLLDTGEKVWLVDWEYSGMNDPWWDLAYCSFQASLPEGAEARLLSSYLSRPPDEKEWARMVAMKAAVALMSALWALIQHAQGNTAADFAAYAARVFDETAARLETADLRAALAALHRP